MLKTNEWYETTANHSMDRKYFYRYRYFEKISEDGKTKYYKRITRTWYLPIEKLQEFMTESIYFVLGLFIKK